MEFIIELLLANDRGIKKTVYWGTSNLFFSYCTVKSEYIYSCEPREKNSTRRDRLWYVFLNGRI